MERSSVVGSVVVACSIVAVVTSCVGDDPGSSSSSGGDGDGGGSSSGQASSSSGNASSSSGNSSSSSGGRSGTITDGGGDADAGDPPPHIPTVGNFLKAAVAKGSAGFGGAVELSADGNTLVIGAPGDNSAGTGVLGTSEADTSVASAGAVYVFTRSAGGAWAQVAYLKPSDAPTAYLTFGKSISLSADGYRLAVGAMGHDGTATNSGAVYVFSRNNASGSSWSQMGNAPLKPSNPMGEGQFGSSVALSGDGQSLAVGAFAESSADNTISTGAGGASNASYTFAGAVYVLRYNAGASKWEQTHYIKPSNNQSGGRFGWSVALSKNGSVLAVGGIGDASNATGVSASASTDTSAGFSGAVFLFEKNTGNWTQTTYFKASNARASARFGQSVSLSDDGTTLAVGSDFETSAAKGVNPTNPGPEDVSANNAGAAYVFKKGGAGWTQTYIKASNARPGSTFGRSVRLSADGKALVVGSPSESSAALGVNGTAPGQDDTSLMYAGAAYTFALVNGAWGQTGYLKASTVARANNVGIASAITTSNGTFTVAVGASSNPSSDTGVDGTKNDTAAGGSGAVYTFK